MSTLTKPAAASQTKLNHASVTIVQVRPPRKVTYVLKAVNPDLRLPYALAVDGSVLPSYANKPLRLQGNLGQVTVTVFEGQQVSLYLNSDAHPSFRQQPVYAVVAGSRDAIVTITEKPGKHADADTPRKQPGNATQDLYGASLTGDIWMKVSHKYSAGEVESRLPAGTSTAVKAAVESIYDGLDQATLTINEPAAGESARSLRVSFADSDNPKQNITSYSLLADGLPRVHPGGYAALFTAALDSGVASITVSSCWRPMLGSISHRAGLGLDVSVVGATRMNRQELRKAFEGKKQAKTGNHNDADNVTDAEVEAFGAYEQAILGKKKADAELDAADEAVKRAAVTGDAAERKEAQERLTAAIKNAERAAEADAFTREAWNRERDAGEPAHTQMLRTSLLECSCVRQLFDPWFMEANTRDQSVPEPNMQKTGNETLHAHHLHITVDDPKIL